MLAGCARREASDAFIQIKGSDTEVNLVQRLAEEFMKDHQIYIAITGGGSGTGIASLINKQTDIANSSRAMKDEEIKLAKDNGVDPVAIVFALDGLALIVHESLPVESLTLDEISQIYRGEVTNWKEVGGPDLGISMYGRQSNSGTYIYLRDNVIKGDYSPKVRSMNGTAQIVEAVRKDKAGIGYVGIGYIIDDKGNTLSGIKSLEIAKDINSPFVSPLDPENVKSGLYPIVRPLYQYTDGKPKGNILNLILFELSDRGQDLVMKEGYYPVTSEYMEINESLGIFE
ncbi:MAG: phosphate ABC transporter substrate-binding protein [Actinobacteria bacterium]|nr:phosphate ABC transporter substrate-binding protein [Actinomycetota bacterium]